MGFKKLILLLIITVASMASHAAGRYWVSNILCFSDWSGATNWSATSDGSTAVNHMIFYNLQFNGNNFLHSATGDVFVTNTLSLSDADLNINGHELTIENSALTGIAKNSGLIRSETTDNKSTINWKIGNSADLHIFPFGNENSNYIPVRFKATNGGNIGVLSIATYPTDTDIFPLPTVAVTKMNNRSEIDNSNNAIHRFWQVDKNNVEDATTTSYTYADVSDNVVGRENLLQAHSYDKITDKWVHVLPGQVADAAANSVTVSAVRQFSPWTLFFEANNPPVVQNDTYSIDEDNTLTVTAATSLLLNDSDVDGVGAFDGLTVESLLSGPNHAASFNWLADGSFVYEPTVNYNGQDTIIFNVCDGGIPKLCAVDTVFITINPVNDFPTNSSSNITFAGNPVNQIMNLNVLGMVVDSNDPLGNVDPATVKITVAPMNGSITINSLTGVITYTPNPGFIGTDSYRYEACDNGNPLPSLCTGGLVTMEFLANSDNDGIVDSRDLDDDNDGIPDYNEGCGELIINGSFEKQDFTDPLLFPGGFTGANGTFIGASFNNNELYGWNYTQNLDGWVEGGNWATAFDGKQYLDILGNNAHTAGLNNTLSQTIPTIPGNSYVLSFYWDEDYGHAPPEVVTLRASVIDSNDAMVFDITLNKNAVGPNGAGVRGPNDWQHFTQTFVATTTQTTIQFIATPPGSGDTSAGASLDLVSVIPETLADCRDTDKDGIPDAMDLDSDNDGIADVIEAGHGAAYTDGIVNGPVGADGIPDAVQDASDDTRINYTLSNTDADDILDFLDMDSDGDGIPDNVEGQVTVGYVAPLADDPATLLINEADTDGNGVNDAYDTNGDWLNPPNVDGATDGADYIDTDSDNDGLDDTTEVALVLSNSDGDNDGLDDDADTTVGYDDPNSNINTPSLLPDIDSDVFSGGDVDYRDNSDDRLDTDNDGIVDAIDIDDDNDGVLDITETDACSDSYISFLEDFGQGDRTDTPYTNNYCYEDGSGINCPAGGFLTPGDIGDGEYAILNDIQASASWASGAWTAQTDHTGNVNGRMALFNASYEPGEFYNRTFTGLFQNTAVSFSFWILNLDKITLPNSRILPNVTVKIQDKDGNLLFNFNTGNIAKDEIWHNYTTTFNPGNNTEIKLVLINNAPGGGGNDLALDDISIIQQFCDTDNDGISNHLDLDSDNDGIYDIVENGVLNDPEVTDDNNDGMIDGIPTDFGNNGLFNGIENNDTPAGTITYTPNDTDSDSVSDAQELDADADGCNDVLEAGFNDSDFDGQLGESPVTVDNFGLVTSSSDGYTTPIKNVTGGFVFQNMSIYNGCSLLSVNDSIIGGSNASFIKGNVLDNDVANYTDVLIVNTTPIIATTNGTLVLDADGTFSYTPNTGFIGQDSFVYEVCDDLIPQQCDQATVIITITELTISEGFSPNGDGINDYWFMEGITSYPKNKVKVFNRWGNMVYQTSGYDNNTKRWDGISTEGAFFGKKTLPEGTYFYVLDLGDGLKVIKGFITLKK